MTETSPIVTLAPKEDLKIGSCGVLFPNTQAKIVDLESGEPLGPNQRGELCVKGPQIIYVNFTISIFHNVSSHAMVGWQTCHFRARSFWYGGCQANGPSRNRSSF